MISLKTRAALWVRFTSSSRSEATAVSVTSRATVVTIRKRFNIYLSSSNFNPLNCTFHSLIFELGFIPLGVNRERKSMRRSWKNWIRSC